jgi:hypothetical protein
MVMVDVTPVSVGKWIAVIAFAALLVIVGAWGVYSLGRSDALQAQAPVSSTTSTPAPVTAPQTIIITVKSTSWGTGNGLYEVWTYTGQLLYDANYREWNGIQPDETYNAVVVGTASDGQEIISGPVPLYPHYYNVHHQGTQDGLVRGLDKVMSVRYGRWPE